MKVICLGDLKINDIFSFCLTSVKWRVEDINTKIRGETEYPSSIVCVSIETGGRKTYDLDRIFSYDYFHVKRYERTVVLYS